MPIKKVISEVQKQTGLYFFYNSDVIKGIKDQDIDVKNMPIDDFLKLITKDQPLNYRIDGKNVILMRKAVAKQKLQEAGLVTQESEELSPPPIDVRGRLVNQNGEPLNGVSIVIKGTKRGTSTNHEGDFELKGVNDNATLVISAVNIKTLELPISGRSNLGSITIEVIPSALDEVQVIAYGATTERLRVSNVTTIRAAEIERQPVNNPLYALQGRVPGLIITPTNGLVGSEVKMQIRGYNSLSGTIEPLIVVDGLPISNNVPGLGFQSLFNFSSLSFINPGDIESISVLKDADATSIYGSRGSGGVILITTKKGKVGKTSVNVRVQNGWAEVPKKMDMLETEDYIKLRREAYNNSGVDFVNTFPYNVPEYKYTVSYDLYVWDTTRNTDWQEELLGGNAQYLDAQATISGGTPTFRYMLGGMYHRETTVFPGQDDANSRGNAHFNISGATPNQRFRATLTGSYMIERNHLPGIDFTNTALTLSPNAPSIYLPNGELNWAPLPGGAQSWDNPYANLLNTYEANINNIVANAEITYQVFPFLTLKVPAGYNETQGYSIRLEKIASRNPNDPSFSITRGVSHHMTTGARSVSFEPHILVNTGLAGGTINALVGGSIQNTTTRQNSLMAYGFMSDALLRNIGSATDVFASNMSSQYKYAAVFGRLSYNFRNKYIVDIAGRRDGSSRFGPGNQFGNFGSIGAGWIFTEEHFIKPLSFISFGKLRFSYGTSGNDGIGDYGYMEKYEAVDLLYQGVRGYRTLGLFNEDYAWEVVKKMEFGLETGFFEDRIFINASYFHNRSNNQLMGYPMPAFVGPGVLTVNLPAVIQNTGLELLVKTTNIRSKNFSWLTSFNFTTNRNKLVKYPDFATSSFTNSFKIGKSFTGFQLMFKYAGVNPETGRYQFYSKDGKIVVDPQDFTDPYGGRYVEINTDPKYYGGISNTFTYRNWNLDIMFQFNRQKGTGILGSYTYFAGGVAHNFPAAFLQRWQKPGDQARIQKVIGNYEEEMVRSTQFVESSDFDVQDVSFLRLSNLSLSYSIPATLIEKWKMEDVRLFLLGQNVLTFTKYEGLDPVTRSALPLLRTLTVGIDIRF